MPRTGDNGGGEPVCIGLGKCIRDTGRALFVELQTAAHRDTFGFVSGAREVWLPQSCVHDDSEVFAAGGSGKVVVKRWFAEKEGLG